MGSGVIIIAGLATGFNALIILYKFQNGDTINAVIDFVVLAMVMYVFKGSFAALAVGTIASAIFSLYLLFRPVDTTQFDDW